MMEKQAPDLSAPLQLPPGFRFHPTDEELVVHYLSRKAASKPFPIPIIAELDLYKFDPWDLPEKALIGEQEWYFFSPRDRKYPNGARPNRAAASGYWKATGTDKPIHGTAGGFQKVGVKKALVFYKGKAPRGLKTNWIMHEYRLTDSCGKPSNTRKKGSLRLDDWVLCRIYKRTIGSSKPLLEPKAEGEESQSCLEDVLASLPDIDDSKLFLPRLGSFQSMMDQDEPIVNIFMSKHDTLEENFRRSETGSIKSSFFPQTMPNSSGMDSSNLQHSTSIHSSANHPQGSWQSDPSLRPDQARHLRTQISAKFSDISQDMGSVLRKIVNFDSTEDEEQSTCRSTVWQAGETTAGTEQWLGFSMSHHHLIFKQCPCPPLSIST
ncbi:hypothetical protein O6H91_01G025000 [Diphasiastrum complanatum]|uniref:Uncharacterized protein n=1 Tax=Diphasiastrum complanatum TaxID=34168 RepID=A0ACC2EP02_DIPCM|nr:hypothetical protein O6H91_01G025000 [Diphasiastrum complanatum]